MARKKHSEGHTILDLVKLPTFSTEQLDPIKDLPDTSAGQKIRVGTGNDWQLGSVEVPGSFIHEIHHSTNEVNQQECRILAGRKDGKIYEVFDGSRTTAAFQTLARLFPKGTVVERSEPDPDTGEIVKVSFTKDYSKVPVRVYEGLTPMQEQALRMRAVKQRLGLRKVDLMNVTFREIDDYPGDLSEADLVARVGLNNIQQVYKGFKWDEVKKTFTNREGPIQTPKRIAKLPLFVRQSVLSYLEGKGGVSISGKKGTALLQAWDADRKDPKEGLNLHKGLSEEEIEEKLPESKFLAEWRALVAAANDETPRATGVMTGKDITELADYFQEAPGLKSAVLIPKNEPGFQSKDSKKTLKDYFMFVERAAQNRAALTVEEAGAKADMASHLWALHTEAVAAEREALKPAATEEEEAAE